MELHYKSAPGELAGGNIGGPRGIEQRVQDLYVWKEHYENLHEDAGIYLS